MSIGQSSWGELKKRVGEGVGKAEKRVKAVKEDTWREECPWLKIQPRKKDHKKEHRHQEKIKGPAEKKRKVGGRKKKLQ